MYHQMDLSNLIHTGIKFSTLLFIENRIVFVTRISVTLTPSCSNGKPRKFWDLIHCIETSRDTLMYEKRRHPTRRDATRRDATRRNTTQHNTNRAVLRHGTPAEVSAIVPSIHPCIHPKNNLLFQSASGSTCRIPWCIFWQSFRIPLVCLAAARLSSPRGDDPLRATAACCKSLRGCAWR